MTRSMAMDEKKKTGIVEFYDASKGFGFIKPDDASESLYVHVGDIIPRDGVRYLEAEQHVSFLIRSDARGSRATEVSVVVDDEGEKTGVVTWFNADKGFGFIKRDDEGPDIFAHFSAIQAKGPAELREGQRVSFLVESGPHGRMAVNISVIE